MGHKHPVFDTDAHFVIDPKTRAIKNESGKTTIIQHDHNSERFSFEVPKAIDSHDMTLCNVVQVHYINIDSSTKAHNIGIYEVNDMQVSPDDENTVVLTWLISNNATQYAGALNFIIKFKCIADDGSVDYVWNSGIFKDITISNGMDNGENVAEDYSDILEQWRQELFNGTGGTPDAVQFVPQELTEEQKAQARENIGAMSADAVTSFSTKQVNALDALFKAASYIKDASAEYAAFCDAFGIVPPVVYQNEIKKGRVTLIAPSSISVNATYETRAMLVPVRYLTKGKSYKFSLGSAASDYYYGVNILLASEAGLKFDYVEGSNKVYGGIDSIEEDSGWTKSDIEYAIRKENRVLCVGFRNNASTALTEDDYEILQNNFVLLEEEFEEPERAFTIMLYRMVDKLTTNTASITANENPARMMICASVANSKRFCYHNGESWQDSSPYSPVPIPAGAVSAVYSIPNGMKIGMAFLGGSGTVESNIKYLKDTGWLTASTGTIDVTSYNDGAHYWSANLAYTDNREIPADFDEETIDVYFVDANGNRLQ